MGARACWSGRPWRSPRSLQALARKMENRITRGTDGSTINGPDYLTYKILQVSSTFHYLCHASHWANSHTDASKSSRQSPVDPRRSLRFSSPSIAQLDLFGQGAGDPRSTRPLEGAPGSEPWRRSVGPPRRRRSRLGRPQRVRALTSAHVPTGTGGWRGGYPARSRRRRAKGRMGPMGRLVSALDRGD